MGSVSSKGQRLGSFKTYDQIIVDPALKRGAMVEIERGWFKHWVLCESVDTMDGIVWCYHVTSRKKDSIGISDQSEPNEPNEHGQYWSCSAPKAWICYEPLRDIIQKKGPNGQPVYHLCRVNNQKRRAQRLGLNELNLNVVFANLDRLKDTMVHYKLYRNNCEWYSTLWKYGKGWSSQVTKAEWIAMSVGTVVVGAADLGATYVFVAGVGWVLCIGGVVFVALGFGLYLGLKYYKSKKWKDHVKYVTELFSCNGPAGESSIPTITMRTMSA